MTIPNYISGKKGALARINLILFCLLAGGLAQATSFSVSFSVCHDFGCRSESMVELKSDEWATVVGLLDAESNIHERKLIKQAIAQMESLAGRYSPLHQDLAMNLPLREVAAEISPGQLDCIDESINTTRFLELFEAHGLLKYHRVLDRAYRRSFFTQHWAAQIEDLDTGKRYVIDSWYEKNGEPPILVSSERWHDLSL